MEKRQLPGGPTSRQRIYLLGRLRKAVKWATLLAQLSAIKADSRTSLETEVFLAHYLIFLQVINAVNNKKSYNRLLRIWIISVLFDSCYLFSSQLPRRYRWSLCDTNML